jgi:hypothetical protein
MSKEDVLIKRSAGIPHYLREQVPLTPNPDRPKPGHELPEPEEPPLPGKPPEPPLGGSKRS